MRSFPIHRLQVSEPTGLLDIRVDVQGSNPELLKRLPERGLAVVGTRMPQARSLKLTRDSIAALRGFDLIIISGLARGIDAAAHRAAIEAGLPTIAVLGTGIDLTYPPEHAELRQLILDAGGLVLSQFKRDDHGRPKNFLRRNWIIANLAQATWVVEAGHKSGALNTAAHAMRLKRKCWVTPAFPGDPAFAGNQDLLDRLHPEDAGVFWHPESLSATWLPLLSFLRSRRKGPKQVHQLELDLQQSDSTGLAKTLAKQVSTLAASTGGADVRELLNWALSQGWSPETFFTHLQEALHHGWINDSGGVLLAGDGGTS